MKHLRCFINPFLCVLPMKYRLLFASLWLGRLAAAQAVPVPVPLPQTNMQPTVIITPMENMPGVRYQYQLVHPVSDCVWLAPAWRGQMKLEPARKFINTNFQGELEGLLMRTINELVAEGWEFVEIRTESIPYGATQKIEKSTQSADPANPIYLSTTSFHTSSDTRYLFRKAL
jgi:hypothetical protein